MQVIYVLLGTDEFAKSENRQGGYNSSILLYDARSSSLKRVYSTMARLGQQTVTDYVRKFDYWLEMMVSDADILQDIFQDRLIDYKTHVKCHGLPASAAVVNFPQDPKPHNCIEEIWVQKYWV